MDYFDAFLRLTASALPLLAALLCLWSVAYYFIYKQWFDGKKQIGFLTAAKCLTLLVYLCTVLVITVFERGLSVTTEGVKWMGEGPMQINLQPFFDFFRPEIVRPERAALLAVMNVVLFFPLGILLPAARPRFRKFGWLLLAGVGFSLLIETAQLIGRVGIFETDDLFFNTLGAILGFLFYKLFTTIFGRRRLR